MRSLTSLILLGFLAACGSEREVPPNDGGPDDKGGLGTGAFTAENQTPGLYRDTYRLLVAANAEDDATAVDRLYSHITHKLQNSSDLEGMLERERETVRGLLVLALRGMQATEHHPDVAHRIGETIIKRILELDPARKLWNGKNPDAQVGVSEPGAALIALATEAAIADAVNAPVDSLGQPLVGGLSSETAAQCAQPTTRSSVWIPGLAELIWVDGYCEPDQYRQGYCEPDRYVEGDCYDVWVEDCSGGQYVNQGYYDYVCYTSTNCQYIWRNRWVWVGGGCNNGYYREECYGGRYEPGLCYGDQVIPGQCYSGRYSYFYPYGTWTFRSGASSNTSCASVAPAQAAVAQTSAKVLSGRLSKDISDDSWRAALTSLVTLTSAPADADYVDAVRQIVDAAKTAAP